MFRVVGPVAAITLFAAACGTSDEPTRPGNGSGTSGGSSGSGSGAAGAGGFGVGGSMGSGAGGSVSIDSGNAGGSAGTLSGDACAGFDLAPETIEVTEEIEVTEVEPVALYLMVDQSGSMVGPNWVTAVNAITTFVNDPSSGNLDVAIQFFPPIFPDCNPQTYANPAVPLGRLPAHAPAIINEVNNHAPFGIGTPIEAALAGAEIFCSNFKTLPNRVPPDEDCVVVFITDGEPTECNADFNAISKLAADAWQNSQVLTYAIGMDGTNFTLLDQIAKAGNTDCDPNGPGAACNATSGSAGLSAALANIRDKVTKKITTKKTVTKPLECEWGIPQPPPGETFDPAQVNVDLLANGQKQRLGQVASAADCATHSNGWYYDNPAAPTRIIACSDTCTAVKAPGVAGVSIALGCATEAAVPR